MAILHPPEALNPDGAPRRVGVELAFAGLDLDDAVSHVRNHFDGDVRDLSPGHVEIAGTEHGTFTVRRDAPLGLGHLGKRRGNRRPTRTRRQTRDASAKLAGFIMPDQEGVAPTEVSCPPLPYERLDAIEKLLDDLRRRGNAGEDSGISYAIGLELEPEAPSLALERTCAILKAYILMADWLRKDIATDNLSDVLPVPSAFPLDYRKKLADPSYLADEKTFLADYIAANPTRDRELDLYPLLVHVYGSRPEIRDALGEERLPRPRPAYRYRLPRGAVERGGGRVTDEWNRWVGVEHLAADPGRMVRMGWAFLAQAGSGDWADETERWLT